MFIKKEKEIQSVNIFLNILTKMLNTTLTKENKNLIDYYFKIKNVFYKLNKAKKIDLNEFLILISIEFVELNMINIKNKNHFIHYINYSISLMYTFKHITLFDLLDVMYYKFILDQSTFNVLGKNLMIRHRVFKYKKKELNKRLSDILKNKLRVYNDIINNKFNEENFYSFCEILIEYIFHKLYPSTLNKRTYSFKTDTTYILGKMIGGTKYDEFTIEYSDKMNNSTFNILNESILDDNKEFFNALVDFILYIKQEGFKVQDYNKYLKKNVSNLLNEEEFKSLKFVNLPFWRILALDHNKVNSKILLKKKLKDCLLELKRFVNTNHNIQNIKFYDFFKDVDVDSKFTIYHNELEETSNHLFNNNKFNFKRYSKENIKYNNVLFSRFILNSIITEQIEESEYNSTSFNSIKSLKENQSNYDLDNYLQSSSTINSNNKNYYTIHDINVFANNKPIKDFSIEYVESIEPIYLSDLDSNWFLNKKEKDKFNSTTWAKYFYLKDKTSFN